MKPATFPPLPPLCTIYEKEHPQFKKKAGAKAKVNPVDIKIDIAIRVTTTPFSSPERACESSRLLPRADGEPQYSTERNFSYNKRAVTCCVGVTACLLVFYLVKGVVSLLTCSPAQTSDAC